MMKKKKKKRIVCFLNIDQHALSFSIDADDRQVTEAAVSRSIPSTSLSLSI